MSKMKVTEDMSLDQLMCRTLRSHAWDIFVPGVGQRKPAAFGRGLSLLCVRCGMERHDCFDIRGDVNARSYVPPQNYALTADETPTTQQLRLALTRRLKKEDAPEMTTAPKKKMSKPAAHKDRAPARQPRKTGRRHLEAVS